MSSIPMNPMMLLINDTIIPLSEGIMEAVEKTEKEKQTAAPAKKKQTASDRPVSQRPDTLVGPRSIQDGVTIDQSGFSVKLDVQHFKPEEVKVSTFEDSLTIEGKHEEEQAEHGSIISRHFKRRYVLPKDVNMDKVECRMSAGGVLTVSLPKVAEPVGERVIPITFTQAPAMTMTSCHQHPHHQRFHHGTCHRAMHR